MAINLPKLFETGTHNILFIDPSGSHLAYAIGTLDLSQKLMVIWNSGMLWTKDTYNRAERLLYMQAGIDSMINNAPYGVFVPHAVVSETFFSNPSQLTGGTAIVPTINAFLEMASQTAGIRYQEFGASTWRSILGIKADKAASGKKDYKEPAKRYVELYTELPEKIPSNVNMKLRKLPNDITDVLCIAIACAKYHGCDKIEFSGSWSYPLGYLNRFAQLTKGE